MQTEEKQMKMSYLIKRFVPYFKKYKWILINRRNNLKNRTFLSDFKTNRLCGKFLYG